MGRAMPKHPLTKRPSSALHLQSVPLALPSSLRTFAKRLIALTTALV